MQGGQHGCHCDQYPGKSDEELRSLFQAGARGLYLGIESGMAKVLRFMKKDHTPEEAYREIGRIREQGFSYNAHLMLGLAGKGNGQKNAEETARFINRTEPDRIINFTSLPAQGGCHSGGRSRGGPLFRLTSMRICWMERSLIEQIRGPFPLPLSTLSR